jgi:hypothetical protein
VHRRAAWVWAVAVVVAAVTWCAPAGAAQVRGALIVTDTTAAGVTFTFTAQRTCNGDEQCDYFSEVDQLPDTSACPATRSDDPWMILWTGNVQNTGPTTENGQALPRGWSGPTPAGLSRLCLYTFADGTYYFTDDALIAPPPALTPPGGGSQPGSGSSRPPGSALPVPAACRGYKYQQNAQKALAADPALTGRLDPDGNGVACDGLPKEKHYISTVGLREAKIAARAGLRKMYKSAFTERSRYRERCVRITRTRVRCSVSWHHRDTWRGSVNVVGRLRDNKRVLVVRPHVLRPI